MKSKLRNFKKDQIIWLAEHRCKHGHNFLEHLSCYKPESENKILFIDLEVSPNLAWVYGKYETNVIEFEKEWDIMCAGYKWADSKVEVITGKEKDIVRKVRDLLDEADVVIGHNGDRFDIRKINTKIAFYGLELPSKYKTIDTLKKLRRLFGLNSNSLDDAGAYFGIGRKRGSYKDLWRDCLRGDKKAWKRLIAYNKQDVLLLEALYRRIENWL